ncbi:Kelch-like protein 28 [Lemmus lemmus]
MLANLTHLHSEQLLQGLNLLRQHHELCDIILRVGDVKIHAHKVVLASISPYFKAMFTGNLSEKENSEVEFQCIDEAALQAIVEYAYTGTVFISQDTVESLLPAANLLQIKLVLKECCAFLESQLDPGNCIGISRFAETYGCHDLYLAATKYICQNFESVCQTEEFFELTHADLDEIVSNDCLNVATEETVFYALESWIKYDVQERQKYLAQLLNSVRLPLLSVKFLTRLYEANHLIRDDRTCKHLLNEALKYHFMPEHRLSHQTVLMTRPRCAPKVLCAVGGKFRKHENSVECWDPDTNTWTSLERMNESRSTLGVVVLAGELYALGGYDGQSYLQSVEKYIPKLRRWQPVAPMRSTRSCFAAAVLDGMVYAIGGHSGSSYLNTVQKYDPISDTWLDSAGMIYCRCNFGLTAL